MILRDDDLLCKLQKINTGFLIWHSTHSNIMFPSSFDLVQYYVFILRSYMLSATSINNYVVLNENISTDTWEVESILNGHIHLTNAKEKKDKIRQFNQRATSMIVGSKFCEWVMYITVIESWTDVLWSKILVATIEIYVIKLHVFFQKLWGAQKDGSPNRRDENLIETMKQRTNVLKSIEEPLWRSEWIFPSVNWKHGAVHAYYNQKSSTMDWNSS